METAAARVRDVLNNKCPRCGAVFHDFTDCCALTCHICEAAFCAWCLADCGADAHSHVTHCDANLSPGEVFSTPELWLEGCRRRRVAEVGVVLDGLGEDAGLVADVVDAVKVELVAVGLEDVVQSRSAGVGGVGIKPLWERAQGVWWSGAPPGYPAPVELQQCFPELRLNGRVCVMARDFAQPIVSDLHPAFKIVVNFSGSPLTGLPPGVELHVSSSYVCCRHAVL